MLHHQVTGSGLPTVLFVHGFGCDLGDWDAQVAHLSKRYRCVVLDLPGHGGTPLGADRSMEELARAVDVVRQRAADGRIVLVGHSLGIRVIQDAYRLRPENVLGLIFVDGRFYDGDPAEVERRIAGLLDRDGFAAFVRGAFSGMFTAASDPTLRERVVERALRLDPTYGRALLIESILWDSRRGRETLSRIKVPLLSLHSSDIDASRRMTSLRPGMVTPFMKLLEEFAPQAKVEIVPDIGHFTTLEAPDNVTTSIERFLADIGR